MNRLPHDYEHCFNHDCEKKQKCIRYTQNSQGHEMTPRASNSCASGDAFILDENVEEIK